MAKRKKSHPSYRLHRQSGQAVVTLACTVTGKRRDVLLGEYDTAESWQRYAEVIGKWEAGPTRETGMGCERSKSRRARP